MSRLEKKSGKSELAGDRINRDETNGKRGAFIFFLFFFFHLISSRQFEGRRRRRRRWRAS